MIREQSKIEEEPELYAGEQPVCNPYHHQRGRAISCNIIGAVFDFFEKKAKMQGGAGQRRLEQVVVEAVDHFDGVEQHNAPARCHNEASIAKLLQGGADRGLGGADHGG